MIMSEVSTNYLRRPRPLRIRGVFAACLALGGSGLILAGCATSGCANRSPARGCNSVSSVAEPKKAVTTVIASHQSFLTAITINTSKSLRNVPPLLFGQNIDYLGDAGGLWNPIRRAPSDHALAMLRPLQLGLVRFPGGALANCYNWSAAIGPVSHRRPQNTLWGAVYSHIKGQWKLIGGQLQLPVYGFDEHMQWVSQVGAAGAIVIVNAAHFSGSPQWSGSAQEAAAWVAYANSHVHGPDVVIGPDSRGIDWHTSRYWAKKRAANGHPAPYGVRYWEIGNEVNVPDEGAGITSKVYARRVVKYAQAMRAVDPSIQIGAVMGFQVKRSWLKPLLHIAGNQINFLIYHFYGRFYAHEQAKRAFARGSQGVALVFYNNGRLTTRFHWAGGKGTIAIRAFGRFAGGTWPKMQVSIDGHAVATRTVNSMRSHPGWYRIPITLAAGTHSLGIAFINNYWGRNLFVKRVLLQRESQSTILHWTTAKKIAAALADWPIVFAREFKQIQNAIIRWAPAEKNHMHVFVTEFNINASGNQPGAIQIQSLQSALMVDGILQKALAAPLCTETNFWCLNSWYFQVLGMSGGKAPYFSPAGYVYSLFTPLRRGQVLGTRVHSQLFKKTAVPKVSAVAVRHGRRIAVNLVNFDPDYATRVSIRVPGWKWNWATATILTGPAPTSLNTSAAPWTVHTKIADVYSYVGTASIIIPAHSAATIVLGQSITMGRGGNIP